MRHDIESRVVTMARQIVKGNCSSSVRSIMKQLGPLAESSRGRVLVCYVSGEPDER